MNLSIIIVNYNTEKLLKNCLESISESKQQTVNSKRQFEIIVVDNGSTDNSVEFVKKFKVQNLKFKIHLIENNKNLGFAKAVNQGIKKSGGDYILLLNTDTEIKPGSIDQLIKYCRQNKKTGIVAPRLINLDGSIQPSVYNLPTVFNALKQFWLGKKNAFGKYAPTTRKPVEVEAVVAAVWLMPRKTIQKVGLFNEDYFMYFEDLDYCRRVKKSGLRTIYYPKAEVVHLHGASGKDMGDVPKKWLIESSKKYHGLFKYYLITAIIKLAINE
jgi:GT2 family glycosyltransferase